MDVVGGAVVERLDDDLVCAEREQDGAEDTATNRLGNTDLLSTIPRSFPDLAHTVIRSFVRKINISWISAIHSLCIKRLTLPLSEEASANS